MRKSIREIEELLLRMSYKADNEENAEKAFADLFYSYREILYNIVRSSLKRIGIEDSLFIEEIVNRTFLFAYENPLDFSFPKESLNDGKFVAWLSVVAKNESKNLIRVQFKHRKMQLELNESNEPAFEDLEYEESEKMNQLAQQLDSVLDALGEKNKRIFLHTFMFEEKDKNKSSIALDEICQMHQTTRVNIRQIKSRGLKLIKEKLEIDSLPN